MLHSASVSHATGGGNLARGHFVGVVFAHWCSLLAQSGAEPLMNYLYLFPTCWSWGNQCILDARHAVVFFQLQLFENHGGSVSL